MFLELTLEIFLRGHNKVFFQSKLPKKKILKKISKNIKKISKNIF